MRKWLKHILSLTTTVMIFGFLALPVHAASLAPQQIDPLKLPELPATSSSYGGRLLLSDSPEIVTADGILYQDTVAGDVRLFFHHVNAASTPKKISVVLENPGDEPVNATVYKYGLGGPGLDYLAIGKAAQMRYLTNDDIYLVEVPAKGSALLSAVLDDTIVKTNELINGIYDFKTDGPVTVKVVAAGAHQNIRKFAAHAGILPPDRYRLRGTFEGRDRMIIPSQVYNAAEHGPMVLTLADNAQDLYVRGIDATDGSPVVNYGNYGVFYNLFLPSEGLGKISYFLNPRGGVYAGVMGVKYKHVIQPPVPTPPDVTAFGENKLTDFAAIGTFTAGESLWLTFSPPGASNLPVKLIILP
ncbi:MAG: copper amine oxidase [Negativicutes bacterium]|nr:copper amine oxidase [Negativicutes bacterium]